MSRGRLAPLALCAALLGACGREAAEPERTLRALRSEGKSRLAEELAREASLAREAAAGGKGEGIVLGRLAVEGGAADPRVVKAQMRILDGGYFAGPVKTFSRPLAFRLHGFEPLDLPLRPPERGDALSVGTVTLRRLPDARRAAVRGRVALSGAASPAEAKVSLDINTPAVNTPSGGYAPRPPDGCPLPTPVALDSSGAFQAGGFTPSEYSLTASAPGHVTRHLQLSLEEGRTLDAGLIALDKERALKVTYLVSPKPPFTGTPAAETLRGGQRWRVPGPHWDEPERKWGKGYGFTLQFKQEGGRFLFWSFYFPCRIADLGPGSLEDFRRVDPSRVSFGGTQDRPAVPGRVYLFDHADFKYWVLFRLDEA